MTPHDIEEKIVQKFRVNLEEVLDEHFPKIEEEGEAKKANRRGAALVLYSEAVILATQALSTYRTRLLEEIEGMRKNGKEDGSNFGNYAWEAYNLALSDISNLLK